MPQGFSIRDTTDSTVKFVINTDTRQKIANLVCFHNRWFMSMDPTTGRFPDFGSAVGRASSSVSASSRYRSSPRRSPGRRQLSPRKLANYCRKNVCPSCNTNRSPAQFTTNSAECEVRESHFDQLRNRLLKTQNDYGNCTASMQKQAYDLKLCSYKQRRAESLYQNAKDSIGNMKDKMFQMKNRINELNDDLASSTAELHITKNDYSDAVANHQYQMDEQHENCNLQVSDEQSKCGQSIMMLEDRLQESDWELQEQQAKLDDQLSSTNYYRQNYEWCRNQISNLD